MTSFFHAYDLRGKHPEEIDEEAARKVGKALGTFLDSSALIVGRDGRTHGEKLKNAFVEGVRSTGVQVLDAGIVPSPVVYHGTYNRSIPCAVVTASHNPQEYTGFKFMHEDGSAMSRESGMAEIQEIYESEEFQKRETAGRKQIDLKKDYIQFIGSKFSAEGLELAVDYGNGVATVIGKEMFEALGSSHRGIDEELDGRFPNHLPDPTNEKAQKHLKQEMKGEDLGIIFDGDGDRAGFIYEGEYVTEDEVLALFSEEILEQETGSVVHDLRASKLVGERITAAGGEAIESRVGHTFISEIIFDRNDVVFAGELSGHYYFPAFDAPYDDGLMAAAFMCELVASGKAEKLLEYPEYPVSPELRIDCPEKSKEAVVETVTEKFSDYEISTKDGVKIKFEEGWALVRPSNTEPKMSVRCEADTEKALERILEQIETSVREAIERSS